MDIREQKLNQIIEEGRNNVVKAVNSIKEEFQKRIDVIAKPAVIDYEVIGQNIHPLIKSEKFNLTDHSESQVFGRAEIPGSYMRKLLELGEIELVRTNLRTMTDRMMANGVLVRRVGETIKGWLSPSYKRMDAAPIIENFINRALKAGFVPYRGMNTDYRYHIALILPRIFHPTENEWVAYGVSLITSDYGTSALDLSLLALRLSCTNLHLGFDMFRRVHLGSRFQTDQDMIELSKKTLLLDSKTVASAVGDVTEKSIDQIRALDQVIKDADQVEIGDAKKYFESFKKKGIKKEVLEKVKNMYDTAIDLEYLPSRQSLWRLSNAMSLVSQGLKKQDERIDLEKQSMSILIEGKGARA